MIEEAYCNYEVSKLLKEKGFNGFSKKLYRPNGKIMTISWKANNEKIGNHEIFSCCSVAPTQQMAMRWLREVHKIDIIIFHEILKRSFYWCRVERHPYTLYQQYTEYATYEEAVEAALKYCLENLI